MYDDPSHADAGDPQPVLVAEYRPPRRLPWLTGILLGLLVVLIVPQLVAYLVEQVQYSATLGKQRAKYEVAREVLGNLPEPEQRFALVANVIEPSVVGVETEQVVSRQTAGDEWGFLFQRPHQFRSQGEGSGVIMDEQGYIITNFHVIGRADPDAVTVKLADGRTVSDVTIIGSDPLSDIAVLKINAPDLTAATWGDSDDLDVGNSVLAVGNPFRLDRTVTAGIISAKGRRGIVQDLNYQDFLQTDAAVNPGNSGGPLVNMNGQVVGINTAIYGESYQGISFAIPSRIAEDVYEQIKSRGTVARGWLGVELQTISEPLRQRLGLPDTRGVLVTRVLADSPAEKAGIVPGDVIVTWNGKQIEVISDLTMDVARTEIGSEGTAGLIREGRQIELPVTVGLRPPRYSR